MGFAGRLLPVATLVSAAAVGLSFLPAAYEVLPQLGGLHEAVLEGWSLVRPGGEWHPAGFIEHKGHLVMEGFLLAVISYLLFQSSYKPTRKAAAPLTEKVPRALQLPAPPPTPTSRTCLMHPPCPRCCRKSRSCATTGCPSLCTAS